MMMGTRRKQYHNALFFLLATIVTLSSANLHGASLGRATRTIDCIRGGGSYYESNPSYSSSSSTLGDLDEQGVYRGASVSSALQYSRHQLPPPFTQAVRNYFVSLQLFSRTLFYGTTISLFFFILWQFQSTSQAAGKILRNHFVCSRYNVLKKKRLHALVLSAFSHASLQHLAVNMYAYSTFGRSVKQTLANQGVALWPFVVSASIFGSLTFLAMDRGGGSCIGLSGVTLALLAFDSLVYPSKELRMIVSFVPIQLPAYYLFLGLVGISIAGIMGLVGGNVAHSTHLGGLAFGALFYEAFKRGYVRQLNYKCRKAYYAIR
ncbi:rhomboid family protein [Skeletonema marinoi]|uniref:Rhomboid family protein n=1 Tax=Skeletonema marinoi TaxID=267567 RepID=A0AAD8YPA3_9STRA|nr:rhomboid family protein [Skeletonema marinoi]